MSDNYYMHLLDGQPAYFDKRDQVIYFMPHYHRLQHADVVCHSLQELKEQQVASDLTLASMPYDRNMNSGYLRIPMEPKR